MSLVTFTKRYGSVGIVLADALKNLSVDLLNIILSYGMFSLPIKDQMPVQLYMHWQTRGTMYYSVVSGANNKIFVCEMNDPYLSMFNYDLTLVRKLIFAAPTILRQFSVIFELVTIPPNIIQTCIHPFFPNQIYVLYVNRTLSIIDSTHDEFSQAIYDIDKLLVQLNHTNKKLTKVGIAVNNRMEIILYDASNGNAGIFQIGSDNALHLFQLQSQVTDLKIHPETNDIFVSYPFRIEILNPIGTFLRQIDFEFSHGGVHNMHIHLDYIFMSSYDHRSIFVHQFDGTLVTRINTFSKHSAFCVDAYNRIVVSEYEYSLCAYAFS